MTFGEFTRRVDREHRRIRRKQRFTTVMIVLVFMAVLAWIYLVGAHIVRPWLDKLDRAQEPVASSVVVTIEPSDTLWTIAAKHYPGKHTGEIVYAIRKLNPEIDPGQLLVGQQVVLPEV